MGLNLSQTPPGLRKSGIPDSVLIPAPVKITIRLASSIRFRNWSADMSYPIKLSKPKHAESTPTSSEVYSSWKFNAFERTCTCNDGAIAVEMKDKGKTMGRNWTPESWRGLPILQVPEYRDQAKLDAAEKALRAQPPLVFAGEPWQR